MGNQNELITNYSSNNDKLAEVRTKLENIIIDLNNKIQIDVIISQIKDLIEKMDKIIESNKKNDEEIIKHLKNLSHNINNQFKELKYNFDNNYNSQYETRSEVLDDGLYIGEFKNGLKEGKGTFNGSNGDRYEGDFKNDRKHGKGKLT